LIAVERARADALQARNNQLRYVFTLDRSCRMDYLRYRPLYLTC
jgi:hypothetical protein